MLFEQFFEETSSTYTYVLASNRGGKSVIIDPVKSKIDDYLAFLREFDLKLVYSIDTHVHADHITASGDLRDITNCITIMGESSSVKCISRYVRDGDFLYIDDIALRVIYTPGHTNDSYSFIVESSNPKLVFTGDVLLINGTGRTDFQGGDPYKSWDSIVNKLFKLSGDTIVYPAHDYNGRKSSTVDEQKQFNPRLSNKTENEYVQIMNNLNLPNPKMMDIAISSNLVCGESNDDSFA